jgi:hypothetical protein
MRTQKVAALTASQNLNGGLDTFAVQLLLEWTVRSDFTAESERAQIARHCLAALNNVKAMKGHREKMDSLWRSKSIVLRPLIHLSKRTIVIFHTGTITPIHRTTAISLPISLLPLGNQY